MASKNTSSSPNGRQKVQRSNSDSARWVAGLLLLFIGVFAASAVLFSFFTWAADQSGLLLSPEERATLGVEPGNLCGWAGARLGRLLVDNSFGVSGILIPVMVVLVGVRVIRQRPLLFNHSILSLFLILILGSLTLGFAFSDKWSLCSSTGWGGAFGIETLAATIGEEAITLEDVYEPYLMQIGFLSRTPRGRCVTLQAYRHLNLEPADGQQML